jgi:hypothetical protein
MTLYSRFVSSESRAADTVQQLIICYPEGVTFNDLLRLHEGPLVNRDSIWAAIELLLEEEKLTSDQPWQGEDYLDKVKLYPKAFVPPKPKA